MVVKVSRAQRAAARRLIEIAEAEGKPVDERLEAIANAEPAEPTRAAPSPRPRGWKRALWRDETDEPLRLEPWQVATLVAELTTPTPHLAELLGSQRLPSQLRAREFKESLARAFQEYEQKVEDETKSQPT